MPANVTDLACNYYFTAHNSSIQQAPSSNLSSNKTGNNNNHHQSNSNTITGNTMEVYKAKPQYHNTYSLPGPSSIATSSSKNLTGLSNSSQCAASSSTNWSSDLQWTKIKKIGTGLYNLGNNCYLNATLQCMAYTPSLSQWLVNRPHAPVCKLRPVKGFCSLCEVEKIIYDIFNSCNGCAKPNSLCFNIKKISNVFGVGTQEDASEFFTTLLESMAKSIKFTPTPSSSPQLNSNKSTFNILDEIFSFQFRSRITCCNCGRLSDTFENTNSWPVDVKYVTDIQKGMLHFLREEVLDGENAYKCDRCNRNVRATKKYSIKSAPNVLVVNLKRFDFTYAGKLTHFVTYPETLSLKTFIGENELKNTVSEETGAAEDSNSLRNVTYKLYGVLVHLGYTSHSGHYYSYVRGPNDTWYKADDQTITTVRLQDAMDQNAYILFYNRIPPTKTSIVQQSSPMNYDSLLPPTAVFGPIAKLTNPSVTTNPTAIKSFEPTDVSTEKKLSPLTKNIPENKFKSTFVTVRADLEDLKRDDDGDQRPGESLAANNRTLNYDEVMKIKKLNKRKLKLLNCRAKLKELKTKKKSMKGLADHDTLKRLKKNIKKTKRLIRKEKSKIKKLKKYESCSSDQSSNEETDTEDSAGKRKYFHAESEEANGHKRARTSGQNGLTLLRQYSSASDTDSSGSPRSSREGSRRSSSDRSDSCSSSSLRFSKSPAKSKIGDQVEVPSPGTVNAKSVEEPIKTWDEESKAGSSQNSSRNLEEKQPKELTNVSGCSEKNLESHNYNYKNNRADSEFDWPNSNQPKSSNQQKNSNFSNIGNSYNKFSKKNSYTWSNNNNNNNHKNYNPSNNYGNTYRYNNNNNNNSNHNSYVKNSTSNNNYYRHKSSSDWYNNYRH